MMRPKFGKALPVATSQRLAFGHLTQPRPVVDPSLGAWSVWPAALRAGLIGGFLRT